MEMAGNVSGIPKDVREESPEVAKFLGGNRVKKNVGTEAMEALKKAFEHPDKLPAPPPAEQDRRDGRGAERPTYVREVTSQARPQAQDDPDEAVVSVRKRTRNMVEKSLCLDTDQYRLLRRYANMEGLRLDSQVPVSEVVRACVDYALAFVKDGKVIPTSDGQGLHIPGRRP